MKRIFFSLITACGALSAIAQAPAAATAPDMPMPKRGYTRDSMLMRWVIDVNGLGGMVTQDLTRASTIGNYNNLIGSVSNTGGDLKFSNGIGYGFDAQLGYFFGHSCHFGIGAGFMYFHQEGDLQMNSNYHVEYEAVDANGDVFRQLVTSNQPIKETIKTTNMNIPLLLKYKTRFSRLLGFTADAGVLFNLQMRNDYKTNASFDYEAVYQYSGGQYVYDNNATPAAGDILYTKSEISRVNPNQNLNDYFNLQYSRGLNVGLGVKPNNTTGSVDYTAGSVGFLARPMLSFFLSDMVALNVGGYYMYQPVTNNTPTTYHVSDRVGDYGSMLHTVSTGNTQSFGGNIGLRFFFGKKQIPVTITGVDAVDPSACGLSDGSITLRGLVPGQPVVVNYTANGTNAMYNGMVEPSGTVRISNLASGEYTNIMASIGKRSATTNAVTLVNPPLRISSENSTDPTAYGECNGTITLYGLRAGQAVTVNYNHEGAQKFTGYVSPNGSVTMTKLCGGSYTNIMAVIGNCTANGTDITLTSPPPPPPPPAPAPVETVKVSTPILFEINKTVIQQSSYPVLDEAVKKLREDKDAIIIVDGYTDNTGKAAYNKRLSMKRANAVKMQLKKMGINPKRVKMEGHGSQAPAADNSTPEGRMQNRRAVMRLKIAE